MPEINIPRLKVSDSFVTWRNKFNDALDALQELSNNPGGTGTTGPAGPPGPTGPAGTSLIVKDEGALVSEQPVSFNFTGPAVNVTSDLEGNVTVNITATNGGEGAGNQTVVTGSVLQVVHSSADDMVINDTDQFISSGLSAAIIPKSSNSKILIMYDQSIYLYSNDSSTGVSVKLQRNGVDLVDPSAKESMYNVVSINNNNNQSRVTTGLIDVPVSRFDPEVRYDGKLTFPVKIENTAFLSYYINKRGSSIEVGFNNYSSIFSLEYPIDSTFTFKYGSSGINGDRVYSIFINASYIEPTSQTAGVTETYITFYENDPFKINYFVSRDDYGDLNPGLIRSSFAINQYPNYYDGLNPDYILSGRSVLLSGDPLKNQIYKNTDFTFQPREQSVEVNSGNSNLSLDYNAYSGKHVVSRKHIDSPNTTQLVVYSIAFKPTSTKFSVTQEDIEKAYFFGESPTYGPESVPQAIAQYSSSGPGHLSTMTLIEIGETIGAFSDIIPSVIQTPTVVAPSGGSITGGFSTSEFIVTDNEDYHKSSDWQISQFSNFSIIEYEVLDSKIYKRNLSIPIGVLTEGVTYYIRARHRGFTSNSQYSLGVMFVAQAPINRLLRYNGESSTPQIFFEHNGMILAYDTVFEYILRSTDGVNFEAVYKMASSSVYGNFCYNTVTQRYVFITETRYVESVDGLNWVSDTQHNMNSLLGVLSKVIWSERLSRYIAVGGSSYSTTSASVGMLLTSTNGISWTRPTNYVINGFIQDVVDTGVHIVYMGLATFATAANRPVYSTDLNTFTITASAMSDLGDPQAIVHAGGGTLYFVTNNNANTWRSTDHGVTWALFAQPLYTSQVTMNYTNFGSKIGNETVFVTTAGHVEFDETSIIHRDSALPPRYIASFGGVHRLYDASPRNVRTYDNGIITTIRNIDSIQFTSFWHQNCINVATDGNLFVISRNSTQINVSTDSTGEFWRAVNFNETILNVFYRNGLFIAFSNLSTFTSVDGYNWSGAVPIGGGSIGIGTTANIVALEWIPEKSMYVGVVGRRTSKTSTTTEYYIYSFNGTEWFRGNQISVNGFGSFFHYDAENLLISTAPTPQLHYHSSSDGINWTPLYFRGLNDKIISNDRMYVCKQNANTSDFGVYRDKPESRLFFNTRLIQTTTNFIGFLEGFIPNQIIAVNSSGAIYIINTLDDTFTVSNSGLGSIIRIYKTPTRIFLATSSTFISAGSNFVWSAQRAFSGLDGVTEINSVFTFYGGVTAIYTTDFVTYTNCTNSAGSFSSVLQDGNFAIAISNNGDIRTTNDGISFTTRAIGPQGTGYSSSSIIKVPGKGYFIGGSSAGYATYSVDGINNWTYTTSFGNQPNSFIYPPVYSDFYGAYIAAVNSGISSYGTGLVVFDNLVPTIVSSLTPDPSVYLIHGQILTYAGMTFSIYYSSRVNALANSAINVALSVDINLISGYLQGKQVSATVGNGNGSIFSNSNENVLLAGVINGFRKRWSFNPFYTESITTTPSLPSYGDVQFVYDTGSHVYIGANSNCVFINKTTNSVTSVDTIDNTKNNIEVRDIAFSNSATLLTSFTTSPSVGYYLGQTPL